MKTNSKILIAKIIFKTLVFFKFKKNIFTRRGSINWNLDISEGIDLSIFLVGSFQGNIVKSITNFIFKIKKEKTFFYVIDIGSNIGDKSLSLTKKLLDKNFNDFKIFSIEPTDFAFKKQIKNINLNPILKKKISIFKYYISSNKFKPKEIYSSWKLEDSHNAHKTHQGLLKKINRSTHSGYIAVAIYFDFQI